VRFFEQPEVQTALVAELELPQYAGKSTTEIASMLCDAPEVENPKVQGQVPASDAYRCKLVEKNAPNEVLASFTDVALVNLLDAVDAGNIDRMKAWLRVGKPRGKVGEQFEQAILTILDNPDLTMPDPDWQATILTTPRLIELFPQARTERHAFTHADIEAAQGV